MLRGQTNSPTAATAAAAVATETQTTRVLRSITTTLLSTDDHSSGQRGRQLTVPCTRLTAGLFLLERQILHVAKDPRKGFPQVLHRVLGVLHHRGLRLGTAHAPDRATGRRLRATGRGGGGRGRITPGAESGRPLRRLVGNTVVVVAERGAAQTAQPADGTDAGGGALWDGWWSAAHRCWSLAG